MRLTLSFGFKDSQIYDSEFLTTVH